MTRKQSIFLLSTLTFTLYAIGCQSREASEPPAAQEAAAAEAAASSRPTPEEPAESVTYEPAYPSDVSAEGLSDEDTAQQEASHAHGGEEHTHGGEEHAHADGDHAHDDGEHSHGDEEHAHGDGHDNHDH